LRKGRLQAQPIRASLSLPAAALCQSERERLTREMGPAGSSETFVAGLREALR